MDCEDFSFEIHNEYADLNKNNTSLYFSLFEPGVVILDRSPLPPAKLPEVGQLYKGKAHLTWFNIRL